MGLLERDQLHGPAACVSETFVKNCQGEMRVLSQADEEVKVAVRPLVSARDAPEQNSQPHVGLRAENLKERLKQLPMPTHVEPLSHGEHERSGTGTETADRAAV